MIKHSSKSQQQPINQPILLVSSKLDRLEIKPHDQKIWTKQWQKRMGKRRAIKKPNRKQKKAIKH
jgi:hypothetical protein